MNISVFELFKGPSSSHTMGPMTAAGRILDLLGTRLGAVRRIDAKLHPSLALTGRGHGTDTAVLLGLSGFEPATFDPDLAYPVLAHTRASGELAFGRRR